MWAIFQIVHVVYFFDLLLVFILICPLKYAGVLCETLIGASVHVILLLKFHTSLGYTSSSYISAVVTKGVVVKKEL